jgi:phosphoglycerate kinase
MNFRRVNELEVSGRRVFVRVDFNVPLGPNREVSDDSRIVASLPTIRYLIGKGARLILSSHLGRPKGKADPKQSLGPVRDLVGKFLRGPVAFAESIVGSAAEAAHGRSATGTCASGDLRFDPGESRTIRISAVRSRRCGCLRGRRVSARPSGHASIAGI